MITRPMPYELLIFAKPVTIYKFTTKTYELRVAPGSQTFELRVAHGSQTNEL